MFELVLFFCLFGLFMFRSSLHGWKSYFGDDCWHDEHALTLVLTGLLAAVVTIVAFSVRDDTSERLQREYENKKVSVSEFFGGAPSDVEPCGERVGADGE